MKPSMIRFLALTLLLGVPVATKAQPRTEGQANQPPDQHQLQAIFQGLAVDRAQPVNQTSSVNFIGTADNLAVWDFAGQASDISLIPADDALRAHLSLPKDQGLIVTSLAANAPAGQAGIRQNDVLLTVGETSLAKSGDLDDGLKAAGDKPVSLTILRSGKKLTLQVQPRVRVTMGPVQPAPPAFWIGISVSPLEPALRSQLKLPQNQGLLAIEVIKDSPAAKAEVKVYDILLSLAGKPLDKQEKLVEIVQLNGEKSIPLELIREGKTRTIEVTPRFRKPAPINLNVGDVRLFAYQYVNPGVVVESPLVIGEKGGALVWRGQDPDPKQPRDAATAVSKRLDDLDGEIKQLRKAIEELTRSVKDRK